MKTNHSEVFYSYQIFDGGNGLLNFFTPAGAQLQPTLRACLHPAVSGTLLGLACFGSRLRSYVLLDELPEPFEVWAFCNTRQRLNRKRKPPWASNDRIRVDADQAAIGGNERSTAVPRMQRSIM